MAELPLVENFLYNLQKCRKRKDLTQAKLLHSHICCNGLEGQRAVGNCIVPMFVDCGSLTDAQQVFDRLVHRTEHSWTSLILGYIQCGQSQHAFKLYEQMQGSSVHPSSFTLVALLKACSSWNDLERGREIHVEITVKGFERELFVSSSLVSMYAKCGSIPEAREVFATLQVRDVVLWTALIAGYVDHGSGKEVLTCFEQMQLEDISPNAITHVCILKAFGSIEFIDKGHKVHQGITQLGLGVDLSLGISLIDMYAKCGSPSEAQEVFDRLPVRDIAAWNALIGGYAEHGTGQKALKCFEQMQLEGISPDAATLVCIVKACGIIQSIDMSQEIHTYIILKGLERDPAVGTTLVDMYAKNGSLSQAQEVFGMLQVQEVVSWTALIAGYAENGLAHEALKCFEQMQVEGVSADAVAYIFALKACGSMAATDKGQEIHMEVTRRGLERNWYVGNILLDMYAKYGLFLEAHEVFAKMSVQVVSWNALISGYTDHGLSKEALECFEQMQGEGFSADPVTLLCSLKACGNIGYIDKGRQIHTEIIQKGFETYPLVCSTLVDMYAKCGLISEAQDFFDKLLVRETVSWTALIAGYAEHGHFQGALNCFEQMRWEGAIPNAVTFVCVLKACSSVGAIDKGQQIHLEVSQEGFERNPLVGNTLIDMYAKYGSLKEAQEVFAKLPAREVVSWTALIGGYAEHGPCQKALKCFEQMQVEGVTPNPVTFVCILKACGSLGYTDKGREIDMEITKKGFESEIFLSSSLVGMYAKCGSVFEAHTVFSKMPAHDVVSWNALITGYVECGLDQEAIKCFERMLLESVSPDALTFVCILRACGSMGAVDKGQEIHVDIIQMGFAEHPLVGVTLVDMYAKCNSISEAQKVFEKLPCRDAVAWNALIAGYVVNEKENMALQCLEDMQEQGVKPDDVTFKCLLTACSHGNFVSKGWEYLRLMREKFGISPTMDHYTCMVDLLARCGHLYKAEKFLESIQCGLSEGTWRALLNSCKTYGEADLGLRCFEQLIKLNPEDASSYRLMADIYASAGRWDGVYEIEELRQHAGARKKLASSWIEVNKRVQEFVVGGNQSKELSETLEILVSRMKEEGHVPNLDLVLRPIFDEENRMESPEYVEKLAIPSGLLNISEGQMFQ